MSWGGGWGNHAPNTAREVAKAFYEGRKRKRGNCETDGNTYWLEGHAIARRVKAEDVLEHIAQNISCGQKRPLLEFTFAGWPTKMTARHLTALGINAESYGIKEPRIYLDGKPCEPSVWYSKEDIKNLPPKAPVLKPKPRESGFVNLTLPLFA